MSPDLSVIITNHNYTHTLPRLLASVEKQTFSNYEVIIVDDKSEETCEEIVANFQRKGMNLKIIGAQERLYVKNARVRGVENANGRIISFIDGDDCLIDNGHFQRHIALMDAQDADIVHFRSKIVNHQGDIIEGAWEDPVIVKTLTGPQIFSELTRTPSGKSLSMGVWDKFWKKDLFLRCLPSARKSKVRRCSEDTFFNLMLLPIARKYVGSDHASYGYVRTMRGAAKTMGTVASLYYALCDVPPFLVENGCPEYLVKKCKQLIYSRLYADILRFCDYLTDKKTGLVDNDRFNHLKDYHELKEYLYILLRACPVDDIIEYRRRESVLKDERDSLASLISQNRPINYNRYINNKLSHITQINNMEKINNKINMLFPT